MTESYLQSPDLNRPPILTEIEAGAIVAARNAIDEMRNPEEGPAYQEYVLGITADRTFVAIDLPKGGQPRDMKNGVVRIGRLDEMLAGGGPAVQTMKWVAPFQGGRLAMRTIDEVEIGIPAPENRNASRRPTIGRKPIFAVNSSGYPWETAPKPVVEQVPDVEPVTVSHEQVTSGGFWKWLNKHR